MESAIVHSAVVSISCPDDCVVHRDKTGKKEVLSTPEVCMGIQEVKSGIWYVVGGKICKWDVKMSNS